MKRIAALALILAGCSSTDTIGLDVRVFVDRDIGEEAIADLLAGAGEILQLEVHEVPHAPITIEFVDGSGDVVGRTIGEGVCRTHVTSDYGPITLSHELGHALGLHHVPAADNVMSVHIGADNTELEQWQLNIVRRRAQWLSACP